jgi:hypothetical protein
VRESSMTPDQIIDFAKNAATFIGGILTLWLSQKAANRNAKANEQTTQLETALQPLKESNAAWQALNAPLVARITALEKGRDEDRARITKIETEYGRALELLLEWAAWITKGAPPPPPNIPTWLREHMPETLRSVLADVTQPKTKED